MSEEIDIQFRRVPEDAIELLDIAPTLECSKCRRFIFRGDNYLFFYLSDYVTVKWCIRCWPETRIELKKLRGMLHFISICRPSTSMEHSAPAPRCTSYRLR